MGGPRTEDGRATTAHRLTILVLICTASGITTVAKTYGVALTSLCEYLAKKLGVIPQCHHDSRRKLEHGHALCSNVHLSNRRMYNNRVCTALES